MLGEPLSARRLVLETADAQNTLAFALFERWRESLGDPAHYLMGKFRLFPSWIDLDIDPVVLDGKPNKSDDLIVLIMPEVDVFIWLK